MSLNLCWSKDSKQWRDFKTVQLLYFLFLTFSFFLPTKRKMIIQQMDNNISSSIDGCPNFLNTGWSLVGLFQKMSSAECCRLKRGQDELKCTLFCHYFKCRRHSCLTLKHLHLSPNLDKLNFQLRMNLSQSLRLTSRFRRNELSACRWCHMTCDELTVHEQLLCSSTSCYTFSLLLFTFCACYLISFQFDSF